MHPVLRKTLRITAYSGAAVIILLAVMVGLFRLLLPQLPEYQQEIKRRVSEAAGVDVDFTGLDARWRFSGPELISRDVVLTKSGDAAPLMTADEVVVGANLFTLLRERQVSVDRVDIRGARLNVRRSETGDILVGERLLADLLPTPDADRQGVPDIRVSLENSELSYSNGPASAEPVRFLIESLKLSHDDGVNSLESSVRINDPDSREIHLSIDSGTEASAEVWSVFVEGEDVDFSPILNALPPDWPLPKLANGSISLWLDIQRDGLLSGNANLDLRDVALPISPRSTESVSLDFRGDLEWTRHDDEQVAGFEIASLKVGERQWLPTSGELRFARDAEGRLTKLQGRARFLQLADIQGFRGWLPESWQERLKSLSVSGSLQDVEIHLSELTGDAPRYVLDSGFDALGLEPLGSIPGFSGLNGSLHAENDSGRLTLTTQKFSFTDFRVFSKPRVFDALSGAVTWRQGTRGLAVLSDQLQLNGASLSAKSNFELLLPVDSGSPVIDLKSDFLISDAAQVLQYLPDKLMSARLTQWFMDALRAGRLENGTLSLVGDLRKFPFRSGGGEFLVSADYVDGELKFAPTWPAAIVKTANVNMDGLRLYSTRNHGSVQGNLARNAVVEIPDVLQGNLLIKASGRSELPKALDLVRESPLAIIFGPRVRDVRGSGTAAFDLDVKYPIRDAKNFTVAVDLEATDVSLQLLPLTQSLSELSGKARITRETISSENLQAKLLGSPVDIELLPSAAETGYKAQAIVSGELTSEGLQSDIGFSALSVLQGSTGYRATVKFPARSEDPTTVGEPLVIRVETELDGIAISGPHPLPKAADERRQLQFDFRFPAEGTIDIGGRYTGAGAWSLILNQSNEQDWSITRGGIRLGRGRSVLPVGRGLYIDGEIDRLRFGDWLDFIKQLNLPSTGEPLLRGIDIRAGELFAYGQKGEQIGLKVDRNPSDWIVQLDSERIAGAIFVPVDIQSGRPVVFQMDRMILSESDPDAGEAGDPRDIPPITFSADNLQLGKRGFGAVKAAIEKTPSGLLATSIRTDAVSFQSEGTGSWLFEPDVGEISRFSADVVSSDTRAASALLGIDSGIVAQNAVASLSISFDGGPRAEFFDALDGEFSIRISNGRLDEVDPGAGRVLGLMSLIELPRRLALDFRDVFQKGLSFDEITADYRIVNGDAYTCNLSLQGPAVDIAMIGRASLHRRDYNQTAVVSANVGNTLPAVGAIAGGPQVAAVMLVVSRIFKKPLKGLGQAYYQVNGSWDEPSIERTDIERFYATSQLADCLPTTP